MEIKYFDNAATTALDKDVLDKMMPYFSDYYYNPSSIYSASLNVFKEVDEAINSITVPSRYLSFLSTLFSELS